MKGVALLLLLWGVWTQPTPLIINGVTNLPNALDSARVASGSFSHLVIQLASGPIASCSSVINSAFASKFANVTIIGSGLMTTTLSCTGARVISINAGSPTVALSNLGFSGITANLDGSAINHESGSKLILDSVRFNQVNSARGAVHVSSANAELEVYSSVFNGNRGSTQGGALALFSFSKASVFATTFSNNQAINGGSLAAWGSPNSQLLLSDCVFSGGKGSGGEIYLYPNSRAVLRRVQSSGSRSTQNGGFIFLSSSSQIFVFDSLFNSSKASTSGGHIYTESSCSLTIINSTLLDGEAENSEGGSIWLGSNGFMNLTDSFIYSNRAWLRGGAIHISTGSEVSVSNTQFSGNTAVTKEGGDLFLAGTSCARLDRFVSKPRDGGSGSLAHGGGSIYAVSGNLTLTHCEFKNCFSLSDGGCISLERGRLDANSLICSSGQSIGSGGCLFTSMGTIALNEECAFYQNFGHDGGAIFADTGSSLTCKLVEFRSNLASRSGGAIYFTGSGQFKLLDSSFSGDFSLENGGSVAAGVTSADVEITYCSFEGPFSESGGAIWFNVGRLLIRQCRFSGTSAESSGAALCAACGAIPSGQVTTVSIENSRFLESSSLAGSIEQKSGSLQLKECLFSGLSSRVSALRVFRTQVVINSCSFTQISAFTGSALEINGLKSLQALISNSHFERNTATFSGGSVYIHESHNVSFEDCKFQSNFASFFGGAMYSDQSTLLLKTCEFTDNSASVRGGVIESQFSNVTISTSLFSKNGGSRDGGCASFSSSHIKLTGSTFSSCNSSSLGGFMMISHSESTEIPVSIEITDVQVSDSTSLDGGAIYIVGETSLSIKVINSQFSGNIASKIGGALLCIASEASISLLNSVFKDNSASSGAGISILEARSVYVQASSFQNNVASSGGGSISISEISGVCAVESSRFEANRGSKGGAIESYTDILLSRNTFLGNSASSNGGAIFLLDSSLGISENTFEDNYASTGGAVYFDGKGLSLKGSSRFTNNSVKLSEGCEGTTGTGGAIHASQLDCAEVSFASDASLVFSDNQAELSGGALYLLEPSSCILDLLGLSSFSGNKAAFGFNQGTPFKSISLSNKPEIPTSVSVTNSSLQAVARPGDTIGFTIRLNDAFGNQLRGAHEDVLISMEYAHQGISVISGFNHVRAVNGQASFTLRLYSNSSRFTSGSLQISISSSPVSSSLSFKVSVVPCPIGRKLMLTEADRYSCEEDFNMSAESSTAVYVFIGFEGLALLTVIIATIVLRDTPLVKRSGGIILYVLCLGGAINLAGQALIPFVQAPVLCHLEDSLLSTGFLLSFSVLLMKSYRLHRIFNNTSLAVVTINNLKLILMTLPIPLFVAVLYLIWALTVPYKVSSFEQKRCVSSGFEVFEGIILSMKLITLLCGAYLNYRVRKIPPEFNESRATGLAIYNSMVTVVLLAVFDFGDFDFPFVYTRIVKFILWLSQFMFTLLLLFAPRISQLKNGRVSTHSLKSHESANQSSKMSKLINMTDVNHTSLTPQDQKIVNEIRSLWKKLQTLEEQRLVLQKDIIQLSWKQAIILKLQSLNDPLVAGLVAVPTGAVTAESKS